MSDAMKCIQNKDDTFSVYDNAYDITIHCETEEEQKKVIERLESTNWIPASEKLPEIKMDYEECYLVTDGRFCWMAYYISEKEWIFLYFSNCKDKIDWTDIVAWMPLPNPMKEDDV